MLVELILLALPLAAEPPFTLLFTLASPDVAVWLAELLICTLVLLVQVIFVPPPAGGFCGSSASVLIVLPVKVAVLDIWAYALAAKKTGNINTNGNAQSNAKLPALLLLSNRLGCPVLVYGSWLL